METEKEPPLMVVNIFKLGYEKRKLDELRGRRKPLGKNFDRANTAQVKIVADFEAYRKEVRSRYLIRALVIIFLVMIGEAYKKYSEGDADVPIATVAATPQVDPNEVMRTDLSAQEIFQLAGIDPRGVTERIDYVKKHPGARSFMYFHEPIWRGNLTRWIQGAEDKSYRTQWENMRALYLAHGIPTSGDFPLREKSHPGDFPVKFLDEARGTRRGDWLQKNGIGFYDNESSTLFVPLIEGQNTITFGFQMVDMWFALHDRLAHADAGVRSQYDAELEQEKLPMFSEMRDWINGNQGLLEHVPVNDPEALVKSILNNYRNAKANTMGGGDEGLIYRAVRIMLASMDIPTCRKLRPALLSIVNDPTVIKTSKTPD